MPVTLYEGKELEYGFTGEEQGFNQLGIQPGWYPCMVEKIQRSGNVKIFFTEAPIRWIECTVLKRNIPIAFRDTTKAH